MELSQIKKALADRAEAVCRHLLPGGKLSKNEWTCGDLSGAAGDSLKIVLVGDKAGMWRDFAGDVGSANLLELWVQARNLAFQEALAEAKEWLTKAGAHMEEKLRPAKTRAYAKPSVKGITYIADKAEAYVTSERQIPLAVMQAYKISMTEDGTALVFPYLSEAAPHPAQMIKFLKLERDENGKKIPWTSKDTPKVLFGKHTVQPSDRYLLITEGEMDCMTWAAQKIPGLCCTSVPFGAKWEGKDGNDPNDEWIGNDWDFIHRFERIYLSFDMDDPGEKARASIIKRLGREICFVINLPLKDANDVVLAGRGAELVPAFEAAKTVDPASLKNSGEFTAAVLDRMYAADPEASLGLSLGFGKYPFHLRWNEWTAVTGINGSGKTNLLGMILHSLRQKGYGSCVASLEVPVVQTLQFYVRQVTGKKLPERPLAERALDWLAGGLWFYDHVGRATWQDVLATFRYAYRRHGIRFFVIDSWMKMGISADDLDAQSIVITAFSDFVRDCDVHLFVVAHPRKQKDEDSSPGKMDVKGSGELTDQAHNVLVVSRNKKKEREIEQAVKMKTDDALITAKRRAKPDAQLIVVKQRNDDGAEPTIDLWYIVESKQFFGTYRAEGVCLLDTKEDAPVAAEPASAETHEEDTPF